MSQVGSHVLLLPVACSSVQSLNTEPTPNSSTSFIKMPLKRNHSVGDLNDEDCALSTDFIEMKKKRRNKIATTKPADPTSASTSKQTSSQEHIFSDIFSSVLSQSAVEQSQQQQLSKAVRSVGDCIDAEAAVASGLSFSLTSSSSNPASVPTDDVTQLKEVVNTLRSEVEKLKSSFRESAAGELSVAGTHVNSLSALSSEVHEFMTEVRQQQEKLAALIIQVSFILSFLGITATAPASASVSITDTEKGSGHADQTTRTGVGKSAEKVPTSAPCNLKNVMRQTIYQENKMEERRAKTIIVSGLEATSGLSDQDAAAKLLRVELEARPQIVFCKRLGRPAEGHVQPLLVALSKVEDAAWIVANAKQLRDSRVRAIRDNVYINANLTKEQSQEAYQRRCKRRAAAQQRDRQQSTAETTSPTRGSRIIRNTNRPTGAGKASEPKSRQDRRQHLDDQSSIKLVYRAQQPSTVGDNSNFTITQSEAEVADMEHSISEELSSDQTEPCKRQKYSALATPTALASSLTESEQNVNSATILPSQHQQKSSSSRLNPTAANFVSCGDETAGSCATASTA